MAINNDHNMQEWFSIHGEVQFVGSNLFMHINCLENLEYTTEALHREPTNT